MTRRADFGDNADSFYDSLNQNVGPLARELRAVIRKAVPKASETIKWGMPVYETDRLVCAVRAKNDYVALQFYASGSDLDDPRGLLEGSGKKMRHVKIRSESDVRRQLFTSWIRQAAKEP